MAKVLVEIDLPDKIAEKYNVEYRLPRQGEKYWEASSTAVCTAYQDFGHDRYLVLVPKGLTPTGTGTNQAVSPDDLVWGWHAMKFICIDCNQEFESLPPPAETRPDDPEPRCMSCLDKLLDSIEPSL